MPKAEVRAVDRYKPLLAELPASIDADLNRWRAEKGLEAGVDIFDTGIVFGDVSLIREGAHLIGLHKTLASERIIEAVERAFAPEPNYKARQEHTAKLELNPLYIHSTIAMLKRRVRESGRNAVSYLELARLHTIIAQYEIAERYLRAAIQIDPNSRVALRAAVQFYQVVGDLPAALPLLWKSDAISRDPWLQSAEIAATDLTNKGSRFAKSAGAALRGAKNLDISKSELALAVATLDFDAGMRTGKVFRMVEAGLANATENALAQGVWLGERTTRSLRNRFPLLDFADDAHEAKARHFYDIEEYRDSCIEAMLWLQDQPFQSEPFCWIANTAVTHLDSFDGLAEIAERYLSIHSNDWSVLNCCVLVFSWSNQLERAYETARAMERIAQDDVVKAFSEAAFGMIAMRKGDDHEGRQRYENAIRLARKARRPDLIVSAYTFYLWGEAIAGQCPRDEIIIGMKVADGLPNKLPAESRTEARKTWSGMRQKIEVLISIEGDESDQRNLINGDRRILPEEELQLDLF